MTRTAAGLAMLISMALWPMTARAQARVPETGSNAVGGEIGFLFPVDEPLATAPSLDGLYEYYVTPRVGIRATFGWSDPGFERLERSLRQVRLTFGLNYNWEGGRWHPFVGAGLGTYFLRETQKDPPDPDPQTRGGFLVWGGFEHFSTQHVTIKGEIRYQTVTEDSRGNDASGLVLTVGLKRYF